MREIINRQSSRLVSDGSSINGTKTTPRVKLWEFSVQMDILPLPTRKRLACLLSIPRRSRFKILLWIFHSSSFSPSKSILPSSMNERAAWKISNPFSTSDVFLTRRAANKDDVFNGKYLEVFRAIRLRESSEETEWRKKKFKHGNDFPHLGKFTNQFSMCFKRIHSTACRHSSDLARSLFDGTFETQRKGKQMNCCLGKQRWLNMKKWRHTQSDYVAELLDCERHT